MTQKMTPWGGGSRAFRCCGPLSTQQNPMRLLSFVNFFDYVN